jgi:hypothetical protein
MFAYKLATQTQPLSSGASYIQTMMIDRKFSLRRGGSTAVRVRTALACALVAVTLNPRIASATLGEDGTTVERDRVQMQAHRNVTQSTAYAVHELQLPGGLQVHEYVTSANKVFAVSWNGPSIPDLQVLLGAHFARFSAAAHASGRSRAPVVVHDADLVIQSAGRPRAFFGMAYLPQQVPAGVRVEQLR